MFQVEPRPTSGRARNSRAAVHPRCAPGDVASHETEAPLCVGGFIRPIIRCWVPGRWMSPAPGPFNQLRLAKAGKGPGEREKRKVRRRPLRWRFGNEAGSPRGRERAARVHRASMLSNMPERFARAEPYKNVVCSREEDRVRRNFAGVRE